MKIAVIGCTGKSGGLIARELARRGHEITAVVRPGSREKLSEQYPVILKDLFDLTTQDLCVFDEVIDAFGCASYGPGKEEIHIDVMRHLIGILEPLPQVRLLVVGGAASLYQDEKSGRRLLDSIPKMVGALPHAQAAAFDLLRKSSLNWTFFSPAAKFDPQGARTGRYILGTDYLLYNSEGKSWISYEDYAIAMADEAEQGRFLRKRFTAVSDTSFLQKEPQENLFDLGLGLPFACRGAYFGVYAEEGGALRRPDPIFGGGRLTLCSRRSIAFGNRALFKIYPVCDGIKVPYATKLTPAELILTTARGEIHMTWADESMLYIRGEKGLSFRFERNALVHEIMKPRGDKAWEVVLNDVGTLVFNPLKGGIAMDAVWENEYMGTPRMRGEIRPDEAGNFLLAVDESLFEGILREEYPAYDEALARTQEDWEQFLAAIPHFGPEFESRREEAAWILWSSIISPSGRLTKPAIFMTGKAIASSWQLAQNAVALRRNPRLAADLLLCYFSEQSPQGQLPDFMDESMILGQGIKPPIQGWALLEMLKASDLQKELPREDLETLRDGFLRWADWFFTCRDDDHDGIPQYEHGDETGIDDSTVFKKTNMVEAPDLLAYLALLYEAAGKLDELLGCRQEAADHLEKSKSLIQKMIRTFWNGERFVAREHESRSVISTGSLLHYLPLILGKRLPREILDRMAADLMREGEFLSPYGLASEKMTGEDFRISGFGRGYILPPYHILILCGLFDAGKTDEAKEIARRYCEALKNTDFNMIIDPLRGGKAGFGCTWSACAYLILAERLGNL